MARLITLMLLCVTLVGCESLPDRMRERFTTVAPKTQLFTANKRTVFAAGLAAAKQIGFTLQRSSESEGTISAYSRVRPGDLVRAAQQFSFTIKLTPITDTSTEVALLLSELTEADLRVGGGEVPLREHGLYSSYFAALEQVLLEQGASKSQQKP